MLLHLKKYIIEIKQYQSIGIKTKLKLSSFKKKTVQMIKIQETTQKSIPAMCSSSLLSTGSILACSALAESLCAFIKFCKYLEV